MTISIAVWIQYTSVTDVRTEGQTDRQTDAGRQPVLRLRTASRGKNSLSVKFLRIFIHMGVFAHRGYTGPYSPLSLKIPYL